MSLNFPTAFWKADAAPDVVEDLTIDWTTSLAQSYGENESVQPYEFHFPVGNSYDLQNHNYPFKVTNDSYEGYEDFYSSYDDIVWQGDPDYETYPSFYNSTPYFGWYRNGGTATDGNTYNLSPDFHRSNPWVTGPRPNELHIFFEADLATARFDGWGAQNEEDPYGIFNNFIQSGDATGSFVISSSQVGKDLVIKVSGLGEDAEFWPGAQNYDVMSLYLNRPDVPSDDFICSGCAPMDARNVMNLTNNIDVQQVKLYTGDVYNDAHNLVSDRNIYSPANSDPANETSQDTSASPVGWSQFGFGGNVDEHRNGSERESPPFGYIRGSYLVSGAPRANPAQRVNQFTRSDHGAYITSAGVGTFTAPNLQLGTHQIKISASSVDATWTSGAFYGFHFSLVD